MNPYELPDGSDVSYTFSVSLQSVKEKVGNGDIDEALNSILNQSKELEQSAANMNGRTLIYGTSLITKEEEKVTFGVEARLGTLKKKK